MGLRIALLLASPLLRITLLRIALLPLRRAGLNWRRRRGHAGLRHRRLAAWRRRRGAELAQPIFELPVAELQFLVLAGQLPELAFQPLDPHFQIGVIGLRLALRVALRSASRSHGNVICADEVCADKASVAAITAALAALRNLDDILP